MIAEKSGGAAAEPEDEEEDEDAEQRNIKRASSDRGHYSNKKFFDFEDGNGDDFLEN